MPAELLELRDGMNPTIEELTAVVEREAETGLLEATIAAPLNRFSQIRDRAPRYNADYEAVKSAPPQMGAQ